MRGYQIVALLFAISFIGISGCINKNNDADEFSKNSQEGSKSTNIQNYSTSIGPYNVSFVTPYDHEINVSGPKREKTQDKVDVDVYSVELDGGITGIYINNYFSQYMLASWDELSRVTNEFAKATNVTNLRTQRSKIDGKNALVGKGNYLGRPVTYAQYFLDYWGKDGYTLGTQKVTIISLGTPEDDVQSILSSLKVARR